MEGKYLDNLSQQSENSGKEKRLEESASESDTSSNFSEQSEIFDLSPGKVSRTKIFRPEPMDHCTSIEKSIDCVSNETDNPENISKISKNKVARRFTLRNNLTSVHLPKPTPEIDADHTFPVQPPKRERCVLYENGKWCFRFKKFSEVSSKERWPSFKWNSGKK